MAKLDQNRIPALDYLRGLAALAVMLFHFQKWGLGFWDANTFFGKSGVYAVSIFFVLSGLTLTIAYRNKLSGSPRSWLSFWIKRFFRIYPLLWLATLATLLLDDIPYSIGHILLNISGLFGFIDASKDIALGAWSIGDELVYYTLFLPLLWLGLKRKVLFGLVWGGAVFLALLFAFRWIPSDQTIVSQWDIYVHPLNHVFFFISGMALGIWRDKITSLPAQVWKRGLVLCLLLLVFYTPGSAPIALITDANRVFLSILVIGLTAAWHGGHMQLKGWADWGFRTLGAISYSVYLLHPLVYRSLKALNMRYLELGHNWLFLPAVITTLVVSYFSYKLVEKPLMGIGRTISRRL